MSLYLKLKYNQCGVGNKLLQYWNLRQQAHVSGMPWYVEPDDSVDDLIKIPYGDTPLAGLRHHSCANILGDGFYDEKYSGENRIPINEIFRTHFGWNCFNAGISKYVTIHLRGGDFNLWMGGEGMLDLKYYTDSIDHVIEKENDIIFNVVTDDLKHPHINGVYDYLKKISNKGQMQGTKWINRYGYHRSDKICNFNEDWYMIYQSDYIISSPSTFAITAGMASNAYIIHSKKWVENRVRDNDLFWVGLHNGGNDEYRAGALM